MITTDLFFPIATFLKWPLPSGLCQWTLVPKPRAAVHHGSGGASRRARALLDGPACPLWGVEFSAGTCSTDSFIRHSSALV